MFPESLSWPLGEYISAAVDWLVIHYGDAFERIANGLLYIIVKVEQMLRQLPWWSVLIAIAGIAYHASRKLALSFALVAALILIGSLGLWDLAMQTLALMLVATTLAVTLGIPVGILLSQSVNIRRIVLPLLDAMQTMPSFVYLIPALMLFGLGKVPAIFATIIYAVPPVIRLTDLGIRLVDKEIVEASQAFGATRGQQLIGVQLSP